jgi:hypothetical protein
VVERERQVSYFVVPFVGGDPATQIRLPDPGRSFGDLADVTEHAPGHEEDNRGTEQHDEKPETEKTKAKIVEYP